MSHTKGPWNVVEQWKVRAPGGAVVALPMSNGARDPEQFHANARLIAAAPELLEALRDLLEYATSSYEDLVASGKDTNGPVIVAEARAAIGKATGAQE